MHVFLCGFVLALYHDFASVSGVICPPGVALKILRCTARMNRVFNRVPLYIFPGGRNIKLRILLFPETNHSISTMMIAGAHGGIAHGRRQARRRRGVHTADNNTTILTRAEEPRQHAQRPHCAAPPLDGATTKSRPWRHRRPTAGTVTLTTTTLTGKPTGPRRAKKA